MRFFFFAATAIFIAVLSLSSAACGQDSLNVTRVGELPMLTGYTMDVVIADSLAFIGTTIGLYILDISNETSPRKVGRVDSLYVASLAISGNLAFLGCENDVKILDVSDPRRPVLVGTVLQNVLGRHFNSIAVSGNILCVTAAYNPNALYVVDITNPVNPSLRDSMMGVTGCSIVMRDSILYFGGCTAYNQGLRIFDLHNPSQPELLCALDTVRFIQDLELRGDSLYAACEARGLYVVDITNPATPAVSATFACYANELAVDGNLLYAVTRGNGLHIFDISIPGQMVPLDTMSANCLQSCRQVESGIHRVFVTTYCASFHIFSTENPDAPVQIGVYDTPDEVNSLSLSGTHAYILGRDGFFTVDVANPASPSVDAVCTQNFGYNNPQLLVQGQWAYAGTDFQNADSNTIRIFDISDPIQPQEVAEIFVHGTILRLVQDRGRLFAGFYNAAFGTSGVQIFDVSDPAVPSTMGGFQTESFAEPFAVQDTLLYVTTYYGIAIYNVADPNDPILVASMLDSLNVTSAALAGNYLSACADRNTFCIVDVSVPQAPVIVGSMPLSNAYSVQTSGNLAYVSALSRGLRVIDLSDPAAPVEVGHYEHFMENLFVQDNLVYTAEFDQLGIYRWLGTSSASQPHAALPLELSLSVYPNPFNPATVIAFSLPRTERATLTVYDVTGREVQVLEDGVQNAGDYRITFDGASLPSGVYFARLQAGNNARTEKLMLLR